jgi:hypothetical protein
VVAAFQADQSAGERGDEQVRDELELVAAHR